MMELHFTFVVFRRSLKNHHGFKASILGFPCHDTGFQHIFCQNLRFLTQGVRTKQGHQSPAAQQHQPTKKHPKIFHQAYEASKYGSENPGNETKPSITLMTI